MLEKQILCYPGIPVLTSEEVFNFVIVIFIQSEMWFMITNSRQHPTPETDKKQFPPTYQVGPTYPMLLAKSST